MIVRAKASPMRTAKWLLSPLSRDSSSSTDVARLTISISSSALAAKANSGQPMRLASDGLEDREGAAEGRRRVADRGPHRRFLPSRLEQPRDLTGRWKCDFERGPGLSVSS
jgi:hypothetical protein